MDFPVEFGFDKKTYRHYMNGFGVVMHCHHYMSLLTKLAEDMDDFGGVQILIESVEDSIRPIFDDAIQKQGLSVFDEKLKLGAAFFEIMGMGKMSVSGDENGGEAVLSRSHVDQGWIKKFGVRNQAVNYWTKGYIMAMFGAASGKPGRSYDVQETKSMVSGDDESRFLATAR